MDENINLLNSQTSANDEASLPPSSQPEITEESLPETPTLADEPTVDPKLAMAGQLIDDAVGMLQQAIRLIGQTPGAAYAVPQHRAVSSVIEEQDADNRVIEGVFDGTRMIGPDGHHYSVPPNYASKSKLVEGDLMKLTITPKGAFVYKQVGPIPRRRLLGELVKNMAGSDFAVKVGAQKYRILTASVTYYHGKEGDEVTILVPESGQSSWAAVENIIKKSSGASSAESRDLTDDNASFLGIE